MSTINNCGTLHGDIYLVERVRFINNNVAVAAYCVGI